MRRRDFVELGRHRVDLHAQLRRRLVHEVDRLVGQEAIGDVAVREHGRGDERRVLEAHLVVNLVALAQTAQDRDRVLDRRLADEHRLEAPLERGILLDVLAVLVERRRADRVQLAAREHRLQHLRRVHRAFGRAGADDGVQLVDEEDDLALGFGDLLEDGLQPLLELAAILRAGDERAHVEREDLLVLQPFGDVAAHDALREAFDDGGLADARLADEHRVVLRAPREHLNDAADLFVAADDGIELALARELGQIASVARQRLVGGFGILRRHALVAAHLRQRRVDRVLRRAAALQQLRGGGAADLGRQRDEQMLGADELVLQPLRFGLRRVEDQLHPRRQADVGAVGLRHRLQQRPRLGGHARRVDRHLAEDRRDDAAGLLDQGDEQMLGCDLRVVLLGREVLRAEDGFLGLLRECVQIHRRLRRAVSWSRRLRSIAEAPRSVPAPRSTAASGSWTSTRA